MSSDEDEQGRESGRPSELEEQREKAGFGVTGGGEQTSTEDEVVVDGEEPDRRGDDAPDQVA